MNLTKYVIRDLGGKIVRVVSCTPEDMANQAGLGETVAIARGTDVSEHADQMRVARTEVENFRAPDQMAVVIEALRAKGIELKQEDLSAARGALMRKK